MKKIIFLGPVLMLLALFHFKSETNRIPILIHQVENELLLHPMGTEDFYHIKSEHPIAIGPSMEMMEGTEDYLLLIDRTTGQHLRLEMSQDIFVFERWQGPHFVQALLSHDGTLQK
ncbi:MAG: hypothetical protein AAF828_09670 [Bacteroidota bacterium]